MTRGGDIPDGLEILDTSGEVIAAGEAPVEEPGRPARGQRDRRWIVGGVAAVGIGALAASLLFFDDDQPSLPEPVPLVMTDEISFDDVEDATFPLFGRTWDHEIVYEAGNRVLAIDLNTGEERQIAVGPGERETYRLTTVGTTIILETWNGIYRVDGGSLVRRSDGRPAREMLGSYFYDDALYGGRLVFTHAVTGDELTVESSLRWVGVGDDIFLQRGEWILVIEPAGNAREWVRGEILARGQTNLAWRRCADPRACEYWVGTTDNPQARALDPAVAEQTLAIGWANNGAATGFLNAFDVVSPSGRYALAPDESGRATFDRVVDLQTGTFVRIDGSLPPRFMPDETALYAVQRTGVIFIDLATGDAAHVPAEGADHFAVDARPIE